MIRPATAHDVAPVQALIEAAYALYIPRIDARPGPMLEDYAALLKLPPSKLVHSTTSSASKWWKRLFQ